MKRLAIILAGAFLIGTAAIADNQQGKCTLNIKGLTEKQIKQIDELEEQHQQVMDGFRTERRSTTSMMDKDKIRIKMLQQKEKHHKQVKDVLTEEQWKQFLAIHDYSAGNGRGQFTNQRGNNWRSNTGHHGQGRFGKGQQNYRCNNMQGNFKRGRGNGQSQGNFGKGNQRFNNNCRGGQGKGFSSIDTSGYKSEEFSVINL